MPEQPESYPSPWYEETDDPEIDQGDIFLEIPCIQTPTDPKSYIQGAGEADWLAVKLEMRKGIVITHSCDIAPNGNPPERDANHVLFCRIYLENDPGSENHFEKKEWNSICTGHRETLYALDNCSLGTKSFSRAVVDFLEIWTLPIDVALSLAKNQSHIRLKNPYKEHFSQAFAKCLMRVDRPVAPARK
jgi:hypothetical protein